MAAVDAQFYWMSVKVPSDQFLLYVFDGHPANFEHAIEQIFRRARACPDLQMRIDDGCALTYPHWVPFAAGAEQVICHDLIEHSWADCLAAIVGLADDQLDIRRMGWRLHVFASVCGIPGRTTRPGTVAVVQVAHALADGTRASAMAARLFGRVAPVPTVRPLSAGFIPWRAVAAARAHRRLVHDTRAGLLTPSVGTRPQLSTNARPGGVRSVRTLVRQRSQLRGPTVTIGVLAAISAALSDLLGAAADTLGAEVPMAKPGAPHAYNHFGNVGVGLYPACGYDDRVQRIANDLANGRRRFEHPASRYADAAFAAVPAALLRWCVSKFDPDIRPAQVAGNTVVSSVHRGAADLRFGNAPVVLTAGYPALSPVMGLTHGVHAIGDTIAISVHAAASALPDIEAYVELLDAEL